MKRTNNKKGCLGIGGSLILLALMGLVVFSQFVNRRIPQPAGEPDRLADVDIARVEEALHLRASLGEAVWPGWANHGAPLLVYNDAYAFVYGLDESPAGWEAVGRGYRSDQEREWQAFAEQLDNGIWVGSMSTKTALDLFLIEQVGGIIPDPLEGVLPLGLLVTSSDHYISALLHEAFHAYQAEEAPAHFEDTASAYAYYTAYKQADEAMRDAWREEARLLARALQAETDEAAAALVSEWFNVRESRRADLPPELVSYEQRLEWLEGLAKYVELGIWEAAYTTAAYQPVPAITADERFRGYETFETRYRGELGTLRTTVTQEGDSRFYYTGMAQARLLDRLMPGWKNRIFDEGVWLETLLAEAVGN